MSFRSTRKVALPLWRSGRAQLPKRYSRTFFAGLVITLAVLLFLAVPRYWRWKYKFVATPGIPGVEETSESGLPPLYGRFREYQRNLPQNDPSLPYPEGEHAKFLFTANHVQGAGWGNSMQAILLNLYLAHESKRAFVMHDYSWRNEGPDYSEYNGKLIPARIPISALLAGPITGQSWETGSDVPRPVSREYFESVCPQNEREIIKSEDVYGSTNPVELVDAWVKRLNAAGRCVEIEKDSLHIFNIWLFGSEEVLAIWPAFSSSPVLTRFAWSPLVVSAFERNKKLTAPRTTLSFYPHAGTAAPIPGLLALHIRRGDFDSHCHGLASWSSTYNGFNRFRELQDKFTPPPGDVTPQKTEVYLQHCFPSVEQIVDKVMQVRAQTQGRALKQIYVLTNAEVVWLDELKTALRRAAHWDKIATSRDLVLTWEQKYVVQAVDMLIAEKAQVFIGNGFSSLSSNVVVQRMAKKMPAEDIHLW